MIQPKKFFDILPPQGGKIIKRETTPFQRKAEKRKRNVSKYFILFVISVSLFIFFSFYFSQADVEIFPKMEVINKKTDLMVDKNIKEIQIEKKSIPGAFLTIEDVISQEFEATGKIEKKVKAKGQIRVFNNYSTSSIRFRSGTRFMAASGKIFISPTRFVVPGKKMKNGKWIPGSVDIKVEAIEPGPDYNIGPTTFSIPGLSGTALYTSFYAKSFQKMEGGLKEEVPQVTEDDMNKAREVLVEKLKRRQQESFLKKSKIDNLYLLQKSLSQKVLASFSPVKAGAQVGKFNYEIKLKSTIFSFKEEDLNNFVLAYLQNRIPDDKEINIKKLQVDREVEKIDVDRGNALLSLSLLVPVYSKINKEELKKYISGKLKEEAKVFLGDEPGISRVNIKISPFFIRKIPRRVEKISIHLNLD